MTEPTNLHSTSLTALSAAIAYHDMGFEPLPMASKSKRPIDEWKEPVQWTAEMIRARFQGEINIGIALGTRSSNLIDIDLDCPEAVLLAERMLADLPSFGRSSSPRSHRLLYSELSKGRYAFAIPAKLAHLFDGERTMLLEIRGDGHQTMFPPSMHPSGELVRWEGGPGSIPYIDGEELVTRCGLIAFLCIILNRYPADAGIRDEICMALTGTLLRCGCSVAQTDELVSLVAELAGDDEYEKRGTKAEAAQTRMVNKDPVWGLTELLSKLGIEELEKAIRKWLGQSSRKASSSNRPTVVVVEGELPANVDEAETALLTANADIFQRGEIMVRTYRLEDNLIEDGINRAGGAIVMREVTPPWLKEQFARVADWEKIAKSGTNVACDPPAKIVSTYIARKGEWKLRTLNGVLQHPTLRPDGTVIQAQGYDAKIGYLLDTGQVNFPEIPAEPSKEDAMKALERLQKPFRAFKFVSPIDRAVVIAAVLTGLVRHNFPSAPLFALDAPVAGTGKSLLAEAIGVIATGSVPAVMSQGKTAEEDEKRLASVLLAGDPIIVIDNCDREIRGDFLCSMLTQRNAKIRPLGKSEIVKVPTQCLVMVTGNNLILTGDISRRTLVCRLDSQSERPDLLRYDFDPRKEATADRPELVVAGLTIIRAYLNSGHVSDLPPIGSFEDWSMIRDALAWLGFPDISKTRERFLADDPNKNELLDLLHLWWDCIGDQAVTIASIAAEHASHDDLPTRRLAGMLIACTDYSAFNAKSIGKYLNKHVDRIAGGFVLKARNASNGSKRYQVTKADDAPF